MEERYEEALRGVLAFATFAEAERTLRNLDFLCRKYRAASDKKGVEYCRQIAALGRSRAELISRNRRVDRHKRLQKKEIAEWFRIWLETPSLFEDWLAMRKQSAEFRNLLASESCANNPGEDDASRDENSQSAAIPGCITFRNTGGK